MKSIMSIAAGLAIGYFVYQYFASNARAKTHGRLHKSVRDKKVAGVCGGIAEYLGVDPTIIRLVWALMIFGWGSGVLAYIVCALIFPEEQDTAEEKIAPEETTVPEVNVTSRE